MTEPRNLYTGVIFADVRVILIVVTMTIDTSFEVVATGCGYYAAGYTGGRGLRNSKGEKNGVEDRNGGDGGTHRDVGSRE